MYEYIVLIFHEGGININKDFTVDNSEELLSLNYLANEILNNKSEKLLYYNIHREEILNVIREIVYNYLFNEEQVLIISNRYKDNILSDSFFRNIGKRLIDLDNSKNNSSKELIKYLLDNLGKQTGNTMINKIDLINRTTKKRYELLKKINGFFNLKNKHNDLSLIDKYSITKRKLTTHHPYYKYYRTYRIKQPFLNYTYTELKEACNRIITMNFTKDYVKYRRFIDNDLFNYLNYPIEHKEISKAISILNNKINKKEIKYKENSTDYMEDFIDSFIKNEITDKDSILSLANSVNLKYNYKLLNKGSENKYLKIFNIIKNKLNRKNIILFKKLNDEIYNEYIETYNSIIVLEEQLSFLKIVINENRIDEDIKDIVKNNNINNKVTLYKEILKKSYDNKEIFDILNNISEIEKDILEYCYNDLEEKKYMDELISILPILKCYLSIEEEEVKEKDLIDIYKDYDNIIHNIYGDFYKKDIEIAKAINNKWDNKLRDGYLILTDSLEFISYESLNLFFPCVISNYSKRNIEELMYRKFKFKHIIIFNEDNYSEVDIEKLTKLSSNIINIRNDNIDKINIDEYLSNKKCLTENNVNIDIFTEIKHYLLNKNINIGINIKENYLELNTDKKKIFILLNTLFINKELVYLDIMVNKYCRDNNIYLYRLWHRDWWIDKYKELNKIIDYIKI